MVFLNVPDKCTNIFALVSLEAGCAMRCVTGSGSEWWLFKLHGQSGRSHSVIVDQSAIRKRAVEVYQAFVMNSWDTWRWKGQVRLLVSKER